MNKIEGKWTMAVKSAVVKISKFNNTNSIGVEVHLPATKTVYDLLHGQHSSHVNCWYIRRYSLQPLNVPVRTTRMDMHSNPIKLIRNRSEMSIVLNFDCFSAA